MKSCSYCKLEKLETEFYARPGRRKSDGTIPLESMCKVCIANRRKVRRACGYKPKEGRGGRGKNVSDYIKAAKHMKPCVDCKIAYPYYIMDFDHLRDKKFNINNGHSGGLQRVKDEIAKCELVCANCHRARTHSRRS